jgi:hypothetical protein
MCAFICYSLYDMGRSEAKYHFGLASSYLGAVTILKNDQEGHFLILAERARFELAVSCPTTVFKTVTLNHSVTSPCDFTNYTSVVATFPGVAEPEPPTIHR